MIGLEETIDPHVKDLLDRAKKVSHSKLARDGKHAKSSDYDRIFSDGQIRIHNFYSPDACGAHNGFTRIDYRGKKVLDFEIHSKLRAYVPGDWEEHLNSVYEKIR